MQNQKEIFLLHEADAWYERNKEIVKTKEFKNDKILLKLKELEIHPKRILEVGCSSGYRLQILQEEFDAECYGVDPSNKAIEDGKALYPKLYLSSIDPPL